MRYLYNVPQSKKRYIPYFHLYILKLEKGKYYVGLSHNVDKRFNAHKGGEGAKWTKIYKPIKIVSRLQLPHVSYKHSAPYENEKTIELMKKYGRENVRGGIYTAIDQDVLDSLLGENLCKEINLAFERNKLQRIKKKKDKKAVKEKFKEQKYIFCSYELVVYDNSTEIKGAIKNGIRDKIPLKIKGVAPIPIIVVHKIKKFYIRRKYMDRYGKEIQGFINKHRAGNVEVESN